MTSEIEFSELAWELGHPNEHRPSRRDEPIFQTLCSLIDGFAALGMRYLMKGCLAASVYGARGTFLHVEFIIDRFDAVVPRLPHVLGPAFDIHERTDDRGENYWVIEDARSPLLIYIFSLENETYDTARFARRGLVPFRDRPVWIAAAEDVLLDLLQQARITGSAVEEASQVLDAMTIRLDWSYLHRWCDTHGTRELLDNLRRSIPTL